MGFTDFSNAKDIIAIQANLKLLSTEDGGRRTGILTGYRPNHVFEKGNMPSQTFVGEIQFDNNNEILPGEEQQVTVYFLKMGEVEKFLTVGRTWWVYEGFRLVGLGKIMKA